MRNRMNYAQTSIKLKLLVATLSLIFFCLTALSILSTSSLTSVTEEQSATVEKELTKSVLQRMQLGGELASKQIVGLLDENFGTAGALAKVLSDSANRNARFERTQIRNLAESFLAANSKVSSLYVHFEQNAYDGRDSDFLDEMSHSTKSGTIEIYWIWENGVPTYYETEDPDAKYITTLNESGIRESEWFLCPKDTLKSCALDPYLYEIEPGRSELMTSLISPVLVDGDFAGVVGVDINLPIVQKWLEELAMELFDGKSSVSLISQRNLLVASSKYKDQLGKPLTAFNNELTKISSSSESVFTQGDTWSVKLPINIAKADTTWQLVVSIPRSVALAPVDLLNEQADSALASGLMKIIIFSVVLLVLSVVLVNWIAHSFSKQIKTVSNSIENLASNEGDLTQKVMVESHQELIQLADQLNSFVTKLASMISVLKSVSTHLVDQFYELENKAIAIGDGTTKQQFNLDNVTTAIHEMSATATEVANLAASTASNANEASGFLSETQEALQNSVNEVEQLAQSIQTTSDQMTQVANRSQGVTSIVSTIQAIAEQTNLLALNAAIEAARAGEQGRGFAVVADEVRSLAARTQLSTQEISDLIGNLQGDVDSAVGTLDQMQSTVESTVNKTNDGYNMLSDTLDGIRTINDSVAQVATAAEEQSVVSEELSERVTEVSDSSVMLAELGSQITTLSQKSKALVDDMNEQLNKLKV